MLFVVIQRYMCTVWNKEIFTFPLVPTSRSLSSTKLLQSNVSRSEISWLLLLSGSLQAHLVVCTAALCFATEWPRWIRNEFHVITSTTHVLERDTSSLFWVLSCIIQNRLNAHQSSNMFEIFVYDLKEDGKRLKGIGQRAIGRGKMNKGGAPAVSKTK